MGGQKLLGVVGDRDRMAGIKQQQREGEGYSETPSCRLGYSKSEAGLGGKKLLAIVGDREFGL